MDKGQEAGEENRPKLLKRMSAGSGDTVTMVIRFVNDDVPQYLEMLERFENKPTVRPIIVK